LFQEFLATIPEFYHSTTHIRANALIISQYSTAVKSVMFTPSVQAYVLLDPVVYLLNPHRTLAAALVSLSLEVAVLRPALGLVIFKAVAESGHFIVRGVFVCESLN
jgi:hypothetical protein